MPDNVLMHETVIRLAFFFSGLIAFGFLEHMFARRLRVDHRSKRWVINGALTIFNSILLSIIFPLLAVAAAVYAQKFGIGLFHYISLPIWIEFILALILLDFAIYGQHRVMHIVPFFWAFHRIHHMDRDLDASSGFRFHYIEIILSMIFKLILVLIIGPAAFAVFVFEVVLNFCAMFNHANINIPKSMDKFLRIILVTPDMHRVHHSTKPSEMNMNFGFSISLWDRILQSYQAQPEQHHQNMLLGLDECQDDQPTQFKYVFWQSTINTLKQHPWKSILLVGVLVLLHIMAITIR